MAEVVRAPINKKRHLIALLFTFAAFIIGILIGVLITNERLDFSNEVSQDQRLELESIQLQYIYITSLLESENCPAILRAMEENLNSLEIARIKLEGFISQTRNKEFQFIKRDYILSELRYWILAQQTQKICEDDSIKVLFFYTKEEQCSDCPTQGLILTNIKKKLEEKILIFSLDTQQEEPMVQILKQSFNITTVPTIVFKDKKIEGLTKLDELYPVVCGEYKEKPEECSKYEKE